MGFRPAAAALTLGLAACATPQATLLTDFERTLAAQDSATMALGQWCGARRLAEPARITATPVVGGDRAEPPGLRTLLGVGPDEPLRFRHVRLFCGGVALSDAQNWYVPSRLTDAMNRALNTSDTPFGRVIAPLGFTRQRLASHRGRMPDCPEGTVLSHRAVLKLPDGRPVSALLECYTEANLGG